MKITEKLAQIRTFMKEENINTYIVTKFDPHQSEYSPDFFNGVQFISGFTGSAGVVVITHEKAGLFTDGRYYIQAERQLTGTSFDLHKSAEAGAQTFEEFAKDETPANGKIGFDGRTLASNVVVKLLKLIKHKKITLSTDVDLIGKMWEDRPETSKELVYDFDVKYCGQSRKEKIAIVQEKMAKDGVDVTVISSTDDIAWLFNLRGRDSFYQTNFASFAVVEKAGGIVFIPKSKFANVAQTLKKDGVSLCDYDDIYSYLANLNTEKNMVVALNLSMTNYSIYNALNNVEIFPLEIDYTTNLKAIKNETEHKNLEIANLIDGVAMVRFVKWVKENAGTNTVTEFDIEGKLIEIRGLSKDFLYPSFDTIAGYNANGAMMHYSAKKGESSTISAEGFLLVDSGAHYYYGTTDITRTIVLGEISAQMVKDFTLVLKSHIDLAKTVFLYGATGSNLDAIARLPMWENRMNYACGTGHGIGFFGEVHEGPQSISPRVNNVKLEVGMIITNEPGVYRANEYGIRTENTVKVVPCEENEFGKFLKFTTFSYCPIDLDAVDVSMLDESERNWLNDYHKTVFEKLSPSLNEEEASWLKHQTRSV